MSATGVDPRLESLIEEVREELGASRARFYAMDPSGQYRLAAASGFPSRFGPSETLEADHPLLERLRRSRNGYWANSPVEAGALAPRMEREHYTRALVVPVFVGSRTAGVLELQDRAGGGLFDADHLKAAESGSSRLARALREAETGVEDPFEEDRTGSFFLAPPAVVTGVFPPPPPLFRTTPPSGVAAPAEAPAETAPRVTRREVRLFKGFVNALLLDPAAEAVVFSLWRSQRAELFVGARRPFSEGARAALLSSLASALGAAAPRMEPPREKLFNWEFPFGRGGEELGAFAGVQTSVVSSDEESALLFTMVFGREPAPEVAAALKETHRLVRAALLDAKSASNYRVSYRSLVQSLLEPGGRAYPQLKAHSIAVAAICRRFASALKISAAETEQWTVAALLHDVGLKELSVPYPRLAERRALDAQEMAEVREHARRGAAVVERLDLPYPVAPLVRHHHERWDGAGYPDGLAGDRIPLGARVLGIVEAYDAMTAPHSYREPIAPEAAMQTLFAKGGTQFDPDLVLKFADVIRGPGGR
jgi:putative nucleotidyltransferase with HDIG domain